MAPVPAMLVGRQELDLRARRQREVDAGVDAVDGALARAFGDRVGGAGDDVGVVAGAAGHVVLAGAALQPVVADAAVEIVVAGFAQQEVVAVAAVAGCRRRRRRGAGRRRRRR